MSGLVVVLGLVGFFGGRGLWRKLRVKRAQQQAVRAEQLLRDQMPLESQRAIITAIQLAPNDPDVLRAAAGWCTMARQAEGLVYWDRLFSLVPPTRDDLVKQLDLALDLNRVDVSRDILKRLLVDGKNDREVILRTIRFQDLLGEPAAAMEACRFALLAFPTDPKVQLTVGALYLKFPDQTRRVEGRQLLWDVALGQSEWRDDAVNLLAEYPDLNDGDRTLLIRSLAARTPDSLVGQLQMLTLRSAMLRRPKDREALFEDALALQAKFPGLTNQMAVAGWLVSAGGTNQAISLIPHAALGTNNAIAMASLDVLLRLRAWPEVLRMLELKPLALPDSTREAALALAGPDTGVLAASARFSQALQLAAGRPSQILQVANCADAGGQPLVAAEALTQLAELNPLMTVHASRRALVLVQASDDLTATRKIMERLAEFMPGEESVLLERSWLDLLFNDRVPRAQETLTRLTGKTNFVESAQLGLALADLRNNQPAAALARVERHAADPERLLPRLRATVAAVLAANDRKEPARRLALSLKAGDLRGLERELVSGL